MTTEITTTEISSDDASLETQSSLAPRSPAEEATEKTAGNKALPIIPPDIQDIFGKPALLIGEDPALYNRLIKELVLAINPKSIMEWLWLKDMADYSWETSRLRRFKGCIVDLERKRGLAEIMRKAIDQKRSDYSAQVNRLSTQWFTDPSVKVEVDKIFKILGLTEDCINAQALTDCSDKLGSLDNLLGRATARRDSALREIDRRRADVLSPPSRPPEIIDSEVVILPSGKPQSPPKAA